MSNISYAPYIYMLHLLNKYNYRCTNIGVVKCQNLNCSIRIQNPTNPMDLCWMEVRSLLNTQFQNSVHTEFVHTGLLARPHSINAPLRYAEYAKNEVKRNRTLRCSREDCSDEREEDGGRERERDRERMRQAHDYTRREYYIVVQN